MRSPVPDTAVCLTVGAMVGAMLVQAQVQRTIPRPPAHPPGAPRPEDGSAAPDGYAPLPRVAGANACAPRPAKTAVV